MTSPAPAANPILRLDRVRKAFAGHTAVDDLSLAVPAGGIYGLLDRKSTRLNSSHSQISYAVFCLKKKNKNTNSCIAQYKRRREVCKNENSPRSKHQIEDNTKKENRPRTAKTTLETRSTTYMTTST